MILMVRRITNRSVPVPANDNFIKRQKPSPRIPDTGLIVVLNGNVFARAVPLQTPPLSLLGRYISTVDAEGSENPGKTALDELLRLRREKGDKNLSMVAMSEPSGSKLPSTYVIYREL